MTEQQPLPPQEKPSRMTRIIATVDWIAQVICQRKYKGDNSAITSVYSPFRVSVIVMAAITIITLLFGAIIPIESAAIARGTVVLMAKRKTVQHLEGGIIKRILVEEGAVVKKGQPLMEISDIAPKANREIIQSDLWESRAAQERLNALYEKKPELVFSEVMEKKSASQLQLAQTLKAQQELFITQREAQNGKLKSLKQRIEQAREEITGLQAQIKSAEAQHDLVKQQIVSVAELLKDGLATKTRLLELKQQAAALQGNRGQNIAMVAKAKQSITETNMEIINLENDFATRVAEELRDTRSKINDYEEKLRAASDVVERTIITAPSEGIVTGLKSHTIGGVVAAGAPIMDIVPQSDKLVLEVHIQPTDIDVVEPGLESRIVFSAYKSRRMPILTGKVTQVSADAFTEQQGAQVASYFTAKVEVDGGQLAGLDKQFKLYPGMPAEVFINTGSRSFIAYMLSPVTDSLHKAFKEE